MEKVELSSESSASELLEDDLDDILNLNDSLEHVDNLDSLMKTQVKSPGQSESSIEEPDRKYYPKAVKRLEVLDDYIRNFLRKNNMNKTL